MILKYLVNKKLIDSEQALEIALCHLEARPSLLKVIKNEGLLDANKIMEIYFKAGEEKKSFYEVFSRDSGLTSDDLSQVFKAQAMQGKSMAQLIVDKGFITQDKWESALREYMKTDEYLENQSVSSDQSKPQEVVVEQVDTPSTSVPAGISAAALESLKEVSGLDAAQLSELEAQMGGASEADSSTEQEAAQMMADQMADEEVENEEGPSPLMEEPQEDLSSGENSIYRDEYFSNHNEDLQSEVLVIANRYRLKKREKDLSLFHQNMTKILSLAKLSEYQYIEKLLTPYDNLMNQMMDDSSINPQDWDSLVSDMLDLLWKFRTQLYEGKSESEVLSDLDLKKRYILNIKSIMGHIKRGK